MEKESKFIEEESVEKDLKQDPRINLDIDYSAYVPNPEKIKEYDGLTWEEIMEKVNKKLREHSEMTRLKMQEMRDELDRKAREQVLESFQKMEIANVCESLFPALAKLSDKIRVLTRRYVSPEELTLFATGTNEEIINVLREHPEVLKDDNVRSSISIRIENGLVGTSVEKIEDVTPLVCACKPSDWPDDFFKNRILKAFAFYSDSNIKKETEEKFETMRQALFNP
jgi:hypothetical protein